MKCNKCGAEIEQNSVFCSYCGAKITMPGSDPDSWDEIDSFFKEEKPADVYYNSSAPLTQKSERRAAPAAGNYYGSAAGNYETSRKHSSGRAQKAVIITLVALIALMVLYTLFNIIVFKATADDKLTDYKIAVSRIIGEKYAPVSADSSKTDTDSENGNNAYSNPDNIDYNYDEFTTGYLNETSQADKAGDITSSFSAEEIRLMNLFLSNFAEAGVKDVSSSDNNQMTDFVIAQAIINAPGKITELDSESFLVNGVRYDRYISASYVSERRERYFGAKGRDNSTVRFRYEEGYYYIPDDVADASSYFSKLDRAVANADGTITAYFTSYDYLSTAIDENIYKGAGTANIGNCKKIGGGEAILEKRYFGPEYANFIVRNYKLTYGRDYDYNTARVTAAAASGYPGSVPSELSRYENGLVEEGKTYKISLQESDWNINYRSSPEVLKKGEPGYNVLGQIQSGSEIYVEYIYDGTWAVFRKDGRYVFASIYAGNDPSQNKLMYPV